MLSKAKKEYRRKKLSGVCVTSGCSDFRGETLFCELHREKNRLKRRQEHAENKEKENLDSRTRYHNQEEFEQERSRNYRENNPEKRQRTIDTYRANNRLECISRTRAWMNKNSQRVYFNRIKNMYGLSEEDYLNLWEAQKGLCAVDTCTKPLDGGLTRPSIDHDHKTGKTRGIMCFNHNITIGFIDDSIEDLYALIRYLEKYKDAV